jgi:hypothetical protein
MDTRYKSVHILDFSEVARDSRICQCEKQLFLVVLGFELKAYVC